MQIYNKLNPSNNEKDKKTITFTINKEIKDKLKGILKKDKNYNQKMKSEWINEAIVNLKDNPDYKELVCNAEGKNDDFVFDKFYMTFQQRCLFSEMRHEVVKAFPDIRGPQGAIIRAAILSRILRKL
jgi:uncharacterized membrane protein YvbJ